MTSRIPRTETRIIGGLGNKLDSVGVLRPVYQSDDEYFTGNFDDDAITMESLSLEEFNDSLGTGNGVRLKQGVPTPGERSLICLTKEVAKLLAAEHCLTSEVTPVPTIVPHGRLVVACPPSQLEQVLTNFGNGLLKSAETELRLMVAQRNDHDPDARHLHGEAAHKWAHIALFHCFASDDKQHRFSAWVRIVASLDYRKNDRRVNVPGTSSYKGIVYESPDRARQIAGYAVGRDVRASSIESLRHQATTLLEYYRTPSGVMPIVKKVGT